MLPFNFSFPVKLVFGVGNLSEIGRLAKETGMKPLLVTGRSGSKKTGHIEKITDLLEKEQLAYRIYDEAESNPSEEGVQKGAAAALEAECDFVIAVGGGSVLDTGKGIACRVLNNESLFSESFAGEAPGVLPLIAVPTTVGSGSQVSSLAVFSNPDQKAKRLVKNACLYPKTALVDPELLTTLPKNLVGAMGISVLSHAMESYVANKGTPLTDMLSLRAIELVVENLAYVFENPLDVKAWYGIALADIFSGMALDSAGPVLLHGLFHPLAAMDEKLVHGEGLAPILPEWMGYTKNAATLKFSNIARVLGKETRGMALIDAAEKSIAAVNELIEKLSLPKNLKALGFQKEQLDFLAERAMKNMKTAISNNPRVPVREEIKSLYARCL